MVFSALLNLDGEAVESPVLFLVAVLVGGEDTGDLACILFGDFHEPFFLIYEFYLFAILKLELP